MRLQVKKTKMVNNNSGGSASVKHDTNSSSTCSGGAVDEKTMPKDARVMISILKDMGIMDFEPRVVNQLLEFSYRYISTILEDSKVCNILKNFSVLCPKNRFRQSYRI